MAVGVQDVAQAAATTRAAAQPSRITIGYTSGLIITPALWQLRRQNPDAEVHTLHLPWNEPREALLDHRVDVTVTRLPIRTDGLNVTILYDEPRVLSAGHAGERGRASVSVASGCCVWCLARRGGACVTGTQAS